MLSSSNLLFPQQKSQRSLLPLFSSMAKEESAINLELKHYKQYYLNKVIQPHNNSNFIRVIKELRTLLISYCKNIVNLDLDNLVGKID